MGIKKSFFSLELTPDYIREPGYFLKLMSPQPCRKRYTLSIIGSLQSWPFSA